MLERALLLDAALGATRDIALNIRERCSACNGSGTERRAPCRSCRGEGRVLARRRISLKIPPGVSDGSRVRVAGEGRPGRGGARGDLYLVISVRPHERFSRRGDDLHTEVDVPLLDAVLGGEVAVPTLKGKAMLKIAPLTQNGRVFRLAGLGMPHLGSGAKGDLYAKVEVILPADLSPEEMELFELDVIAGKPTDPREEPGLFGPVE